MSTVKLDIDKRMTSRDREDMEKLVAFVGDITGLPLELRAILPTRHGAHVIIECVEKLKMIEVVCLQAIMGSDPKRETFNFARVRKLGDVPAFWRSRLNVLYSEKI